jgi:Bacterial Ig-like domain (group 3)
MKTRHAVLLTLTLTLASFASAATRTWSGAVDNLWSTGGNWSGGIAPVDGDALVFPSGAANTTNVNDIAGLDLLSVAFTGGTYSVSGNAVTLSGGMTSSSLAAAAWSIPATLTASQTFDNDAALTLASSIALNGFTLILENVSLFSGTITGTGAVEIITGLQFSGTASFTGTVTLQEPPLQGPVVHFTALGSITAATLQGRGTVTGRGTVSTTNLTNSVIAPGGTIGTNGTGILTTGALTMSGGTYSIDINGTVPGTNYDQLAVNGSVTLGSPTLEIFLPGVLPSAGQSFTIIANDGADPVSGTFAGLPEGSTFTTSGVTFQISYAGGDGNDVVLTVPLAGGPKIWTGAVNNLWSVGGNWTGGVAPVDGDDLIFPDTGANRTMTNDIAGLDLGFVRFTGDLYNATGNAVTLAEGLFTDSIGITWGIPTTLTASQTFINDGGAWAFASAIQLNVQTLTFDEDRHVLTGSINGVGNVVLSGVAFEHTGASTFSGTFTLQEISQLNVPASGSLTPAAVQGEGIISGEGTLAAVTLNGGAIAPGPSTAGMCCSNLPGRLSTGSLTLDPGSLRVDLNGPLPGTNYDQVAVTGTVALDQTPLAVSAGVAPTPGQSFTIISNDGTDPVIGTFAAQPEGQVFVADGTQFRISYLGGDGNDVVLYAIAPTTATLESSENPTIAGRPITFTATVTSGAGTPTGTVTFFGSGGAVLGSAPVGPDGTASITMTMAAGTHAIIASFEGTGPFNDSDSAALNQAVEPGVGIPTLGQWGLLLCAAALGLAGALALRT